MFSVTGLFHLYEVLRVTKIIETARRMVVARGWGEERMGSYCLVGAGFQFYKMKRAIERDGTDGCTTL